MKYLPRMHRFAFAAVTAGLLFGLAGCWSTSSSAKPSDTELAPDSVHEHTAEEILRRLGQHYRSVSLNNDLSETLLARYLDALDPNRLYFVQDDIDRFARWRHKLDDQLEDGNLTAGYAIYDVYQQRVHERMSYVNSLIEAGIDELDLEDEESLVLDRSDAAWPEDQAHANDLWRQRLEDAVLVQRLDGESDDDIVDGLKRRYSSQITRLEQNTPEDVFQVYINALTETFDPHTTYFTPHNSENFSISMSRSLEGIGAVLQAEEEYTKVVRLVPGGPAAKSGKVQPADRIVGVAQGDEDMVNIIGWRLDEVVNLIRGPKGTVVRLEIIPSDSASEHKTRTISIERNRVVLEDQAAQSKIIEVPRGEETLRLGVITIPAFYIDFDAYHAGDPDYTSTTRDVARLIMSLHREDVDGMIIDLRDNGGGSLQEATQLVSLFIAHGPTVQVRDANGEVSVLPDQYPGTLYNGPMAVMVNRYSASASEIFAGAMQDYGRALIVGDDTFGKGTVQTLMSLDHGQLKMTQAKFYRVSGASNQHRGIIPDITMPFLVNKEEIGESALPNALPWDQIRAARFSPMADLSPYIETLTKRHHDRIDDNPEFDYVREQLALAAEQRQRKALPLQLAARKAVQDTFEEQRLAIENRLRAARGEKPLASMARLKELEEERVAARVAGEDDDRPDPYLEETGEVLADLIGLATSTSSEALALEREDKTPVAGSF